MRHGNEDSEAQNPYFHCCKCSPIGVCVVAAAAITNFWRILKIDFKMALLQSGPTDRSVYVLPLREYKLKNELWLLLVTGYGLVNPNFKW